MAPTPQKQKQIAERQAQISKMYLEGKTQNEISLICHCAIGTVNRDLKIINARWLADATTNLAERKARELAKLDNLEGQAWISFFESKLTTERGQGQRKKPPQKKGDKIYETTSTFSKEIESAGDPRFMNIIADCIERRCRILGVDAPGKLELSGNDGGPIEYKNRSKIAIHELAVLLKANGVTMTDEEEPEPDEVNPARDED